MLRRLLDRLHPTFTDGGRWHKFYPLYEALDTFLYTPGEVTHGPSHIRDAMDLKRMMILVVISLIPPSFMACWNTGFQANRAIENRREAIVLVDQGLLTADQMTDSLRAAEGVPLADVLARNKILDRAQFDAAVADRERVEGIGLEAIGFDTNWQGDVYEWMGFQYDPDSFLANFVYGALFFLPLYIVTMTAGGLWEALFAITRRHEINEGFLVTGLLYPLTLPPDTPLWQTALGISFGVVIGKEIFGGTGKNFLNPALVARAFLYFAYPASQSGDQVWLAVDGWSGATTLTLLGSGGAAMAEQVGASGLDSVLHVTWWQAFLGTIQGSIGETSALACLIGAAILIVTGVGSWRIMAACVVGMVAMSTVFWLVGSDTNAMFALSPWWHFVVGSFAFGVVYMATDPVSASQTEAGKWAFGILIGVMTVLIRVINPAYPEGVMLAVLFANVFAPLIDYAVIQANIKRRLARNAA